MKLHKTKLDDCYLLENSTFSDDRGSFTIKYNSKELKNMGLNFKWTQENESTSLKNVLRGLHIQPNTPQTKLVYVNTGRIIDAVVDLRTDSPTFGKCETFILDADDDFSLYVPAGFAHGFMTLCESKVCYKIGTNDYNPADEVSIDLFDKDLGIDWPKECAIINDKDKFGISYQAYVENYV